MNNPDMVVSLRGRQPNPPMYFGDWIELFELGWFISYIGLNPVHHAAWYRGLVPRVVSNPQHSI